MRDEKKWMIDRVRIIIKQTTKIANYKYILEIEIKQGVQVQVCIKK